jgi:hypothetical protein
MGREPQITQISQIMKKKIYPQIGQIRQNKEIS